MYLRKLRDIDKKFLIRPEIFACVLKLRDIRKNILICPEKFLVDSPGRNIN